MTWFCYNLWSCEKNQGLGVRVILCITTDLRYVCQYLCTSVFFLICKMTKITLYSKYLSMFASLLLCSHTWKNNLGRTGFICLHVLTTVHPCGMPGQKLKAGQSPWMNYSCLAPHGWLGLFFYTTQDHQSMAHITHNGVVRTTLVNQENELQASCRPLWWKHPLNWDPPSQPCDWNLTNASYTPQSVPATLASNCTELHMLH